MRSTPGLERDPVTGLPPGATRRLLPEFFYAWIGLRLAQGAAGIGMCNITKCCTEVCPEGIHITDNGIIPMKERVIDDRYDPLVWLGNKIRRRRKDDTPA